MGVTDRGGFVDGHGREEVTASAKKQRGRRSALVIPPNSA